MNLTAATVMTQEQARELLHDGKHHDPTVTKLAEAFLAGKHLIRLGNTIRAGGLYPESLMPRLAVARYGWQIVRFDLRSPDRFYSGTDLIVFEHPLLNRDQVAAILKREQSRQLAQFQFSPFTAVGLFEPGRGGPIGEARVPNVPPSLIAKAAKVEGGKNGLERCAVIFETDWTPVPQPDPAFISQVAGPWWEVVGTWDITPLEAELLSKMAFQG